ncbi:MAG TPA: ATP-binding protein, partial [Opitutaceae bacterium]|nr:ATP-binding protein [Opitutaceae bacterium]
LGQPAESLLPLAKNGRSLTGPEHPVAALLAAGSDVDGLFEWQGEAHCVLRVKGRYAEQADGERFAMLSLSDASDTIRLSAALSHEEKALQKRNELEAIVTERTAELRRALEEYEVFAYSVAHDLRAPLRRIRGFGEILSRHFARAMPVEARELLARVIAGASAMDRLIEDLLAYSRVTSAEIELAPLDLEATVDQTLSALAGDLEQRRARVRVARPMPVVIGSRVLLEQALMNLLGNAVKFVAAGIKPEIAVRAERGGGRVRIWIEDNGIGVPAESAEKIFQVFHRLHSQKTFPGTGIGLAIVRRAAERMHGRAGLETAERGSRFWVELPAG